MVAAIPAESLFNQKLDMLLIESIEGRDKHGRVLYKCSCDCGEVIIKAKSTLISKAFKSCGCKRFNNGKTKDRVLKL